MLTHCGKVYLASQARDAKKADEKAKEQKLIRRIEQQRDHNKERQDSDDRR